jgi:hypothetical protein
MKLSRMNVLWKSALLAVSAAILILPAYGQQDMNPTWYNPWPDASKPEAKPAPAKIAAHKNAKATHKNHASATRVKTKQAPAPEPLRTAEALPQVKK